MNIELNTTLYKSQGIDVKNIQNTVDKILTSSNSKEVVTVDKIDYSKFNRATLGVDLYSSRTNVDLQKQIATNQTNLYLKSVNVSELNSKAASSLYFGNAAQTTVAQVNQDIELAAPKVLEKTTKSLESEATADKNSNSSNKFNPFAKSGNSSNNQE